MMSLQPNKNNDFGAFNENESNTGIRQVLEKYLYYWKWFLLAIVLSLTFANLHLRYSTKEYAVKAQILLNAKETTSPELAALSDAAAGFIGHGANAVVTDQIKILQSRRLIYKTVLKNRLNRHYFIKGNITAVEVVESKSPAVINFVDNSLELQEDFKGFIEISHISSTHFKVTHSDMVKAGMYEYGMPVISELGVFKIVPNSKNMDGAEYIVKLQSVWDAVEHYRKKLQVMPDGDKNSMIVNFSLVDNLRERGAILINSLIYNYNQESKEDGSMLAEATSAFINDRLELITNDLKGVDKNLADYKTSNKLNNTEMESGAFLQNAMEVDKEVVELSAQLHIANQLITTLQGNKNVLLPSNVGIQDAALSEAINSYNRLTLEKQEYSKSMRTDNPAMETLNKNISDVKEGIQGSLRLYQINLQSSLKIIGDKKGKINEKLIKLPEQELGFRNIARQQQIVEAIYLFLLQKREEAEIKASAKVDVLKVVDEAYASKQPVTPQTKIIYLGALLFGLFIPLAIISLKFKLNNKIKDKADFKYAFNGAFLGDIPSSKEKLILQKDRSALAEAFRIIRSNLNFIVSKGSGAKIILITSTISGEGKTFSALNLSQILGITSKKVILVGADLRAPKILDYLNLSKETYNCGVTDLIVNKNLKLDTCIISKPQGYFFDLLPSGSIPPNPSELLLDDKFNQILSELKLVYDYVIVDTAPVGVVTDTQIIADYADATIFIARSNFLDKRLIGVLKDMYLNKKLKNIALIINDLNYIRDYGYGYAYGYEGASEKPKWYRFFSKNQNF